MTAISQVSSSRNKVSGTPMELLRFPSVASTLNRRESDAAINSLVVVFPLVPVTPTTVRPPRLGGNQRVGVFASRSPFRPNSMGLSCVRLLGVEYREDLGPVLRVAGADLMDETPIFDIKPYVPLADCRPEAVGGFSDRFGSYHLRVEMEERWKEKVPPEKLDALLGVLGQDPRPSYQKDPERVYGMEFAGMEVKFRVQGRQLEVCEITKEE